MSADFLPTIVLLAGGKGMRLGGLTTYSPKALVKVKGVPFIAIQLKLLASQGVTEVVISVGHMSDQIINFVGAGSQFNLKVSYSEDGDTPLGTGGAVRKASSIAGDQFGVIYGDSFLDVPFLPIYTAFQSEGLPALMTVLHNKNDILASNTEYARGKIKNYGKGLASPFIQHIDFGLSFFKREAFAPFSDTQSFDLSDVFTHLIKDERLGGYEVDKRFYEVGTAQGIADLESYLDDNPHFLAQLASYN